MTSPQRGTLATRSDSCRDVLIVDDVAALRNLYETVLEDGGPFQVVEQAENGEEAIEHAEATDPDLVLLDLSMPGMGGLEALPKIREHLPDASIVILSGFQEERFGEKAMELGADAYMEKGQEPDQLVDRLAGVLDIEISMNGSQPEADEEDTATSPPPRDEELQEFAHAASHDLQEPLRTVRSYLDLLEERYEDDLDEEGLEMVEYASEGAQRMQEMIDGLLTYSRIQAGDSEPERVDLGAILDDALANLSLILEERGVDIEHQPLPEATVEPSRFTQLLQNLIENAIYHHEGTPTIEIGAQESEDTVEVYVADDGPGIPEDEQDELFALFRQGSTTSDPDSCGLGLSICRRIVEEHDGSISIDSEPGEGTTVYVQIPKQAGPSEGRA